MLPKILAALRSKTTVIAAPLFFVSMYQGMEVVNRGSGVSNSEFED
jgi:hypothetical protein